MNRAQQIDLALAQPGMLLAAPLLDANGAVLLPQGASLSESSLAGLRRRGIDSCVVSLAEDEPDPARRAAERERACARLRQLFRHRSDPDDSDAAPELLRVLTAYRQQD
jgi:hypothetical protein